MGLLQVQGCTAGVLWAACRFMYPCWLFCLLSACCIHTWLHPAALTAPLIRCCKPPSTTAAAPYTNVLDCVKSTLRTSGVRGPFQVRPPVSSRLSMQCAGMQGETHCKPSDGMPLCMRSSAVPQPQPAAAACSQQTVWGAVWLADAAVFCALNSDPHHHHALQGLSATLLRNAPANSVYLGSFEVRWVGQCGTVQHAVLPDLPAPTCACGMCLAATSNATSPPTPWNCRALHRISSDPPLLRPFSNTRC